MTVGQIEETEARVVSIVQEALPVHSAVVPLEEAMGVGALRAVFGERYPEQVRVVSIGPTVEQVRVRMTRVTCQHVPRASEGGEHRTDRRAGVCPDDTCHESGS